MWGHPCVWNFPNCFNGTAWCETCGTRAQLWALKWAKLPQQYFLPPQPMDAAN